MARHYENRVAIIGMAGRDSVGPMREFVNRYQLGFLQHTADIDGLLWSRLRVAGQPAWIFIERSGHAHTRYGQLSDETLTMELDRLVA